jgi:hypothetical protein
MQGSVLTMLTYWPEDIAFPEHAILDRHKGMLGVLYGPSA